MSEVAVLVCDDSALARKQLIRVLPSGWPVRIAQAANGLEGLQAIRQGNGDVVFLDLTMPQMDGYELLEALQAENLLLGRTVIVVSADIQDAAITRVIAMGAAAFLKKPIDATQLQQQLLDLGLLPESSTSVIAAAGQQPPQIAFRDAFCEVTNIAMGRAAAMLAKILNVFIKLPIASVNMLEVGELQMALADARDAEQVTAICQGYIGGGISGEALLIFHDSERADMANLMQWKGESPAAQMEMMLDLASILIGAFLNALSEQWQGHFSVGHPVLLAQGAPISELIRINETRWKRTLAVEVSYSIEGKSIHFDLLLLFSEDSVASLAEKISYLASE